MTDDTCIREATLDDLEHLLHHRRAMFASMGHPDDRLERTLVAARAYFMSALADGSCRAWVAVSADRVIGGTLIVFAHWPGVPGSSDARRPWILNVYVEPEFRRRGIARAMMLAAIEHCRAQGLPFVSLHASDEGRPLYESLGFAPTNEMRLKLES